MYIKPQNFGDSRSEKQIFFGKRGLPLVGTPAACLAPKHPVFGGLRQSRY
jgi:hypothetical protein